MTLSGCVRWFSTTKGYGFVEADDGKGDILLHIKELRAFGVTFVDKGWRVVARVETTPRGRHAVEVLEVRPPGPEKPPADAGPLEPARVRWFNRELGYGFVNLWGRSEDVFLHMATLREHGFGAVADGEALAVRAAAGPNGLTVCEVRGWDQANRPRGRLRASRRAIALPSGRSRPALPGDVDPQLMAAVLAVLRDGARGGPRPRP